MAILGILIGVLALVATLWGVFYSRGQLREAKAIREQSERNAAAQMEEDNLWAEKQIKAATLLCKLADTDRLDLFGGFGGKVKTLYAGGSVGMLFGDDVRKQILGQLIEKNDDNTYALRPIDISQLRLKATRDLIDFVLVTFKKFQKEKPKEAKDVGL